MGTEIKEYVEAFDHWIAFFLLLFLGGKMIAGSFKKMKVTKYRIFTPGGTSSPFQLPQVIDAFSRRILICFGFHPKYLWRCANNWSRYFFSCHVWGSGSEKMSEARWGLKSSYWVELY